MNRNTKKILKFVVFAVTFVTVGPGMVRFLFGEGTGHIDPVEAMHVPHGLPESPEERMLAAHKVVGGSHHVTGSVHVADLTNFRNKPVSTVKVPHKMGVKDFEKLAQPDQQPAEVPGAGVGDVPHNAAGHKQWYVGMDMTGVSQIDWHNYEAIAIEGQRSGFGEQGGAVILTSAEEAKKQELYKVNGFNAFASDKISLDRAIKDIRHPQCNQKKYLEILPNVSVVIPFHNEHWTTLLRSAHSVLNRSPSHLIHEILLVDDFSSKEFLKKKLDDHVAKNYGGKVKVIHAERREGLIRTRLLGAKQATGQVLIFLDSHVEANTNWLPPLLEPIAKDYKTVVCPFIDVIDFETFAYRAQDEGARGAFDWEFFYKRLPLLPEDLKHPADPFKSPVMAGGLFAISTKWFWELGGYDPGLDIWGGEQYELSFKLWQCGGEMVDAPCSRVGHIYRKFAPFPNPGVGDFVGRNYRRVAEVWMDEYAEYLYKRRPHYRNIDTGDLTEQRAIRTKLHCKPFKWFMQEVAFDLSEHYPPVEPPNFGEGELRNDQSNLCVDTRFHNQNERFGLETCIKDHGAGGQQQLELTWHHDIRPKKSNLCFDVSTSVPKAPIILYHCHGMKGNQHFKYNLKTKQLFHPISHQCLDCDGPRKELFMNPCSDSSLSQRWTWENLNVTMVQHEWEAS